MHNGMASFKLKLTCYFAECHVLDVKEQHVQRTQHGLLPKLTSKHDPNREMWEEQEAGTTSIFRISKQWTAWYNQRIEFKRK